MLAIVGWLFVQRLPVDLLRIPLFSLSICASVCSFCAQMLTMVSLRFFLQNVLGRDEVATCLLLATIVLAPIAGQLIEHVHAGLLGRLGRVVRGGIVSSSAAAGAAALFSQ